MDDQPKVSISKDLAAIIDKYRESLTREEFIDLCVKTFLKDQSSTISEAEDFFPSLGQHVTKKDVSKQYVQEKKEKPEPTTIAIRGPVVQQEVKEIKEAPLQVVTEVKEFPGAKYMNDRIFIALWLVAVGLYGFGDLITTSWAFEVGFVEANPIAALFRNIVNMALFKVATIIAAFLISYTVFSTKKLIFSAPIMMLIAGTFLTINNLYKIYNLLL